MSTDASLASDACTRCGNVSRRRCYCGRGHCRVCGVTLHPASELRAHLDTLVPGFFVYSQLIEESGEFDAVVHICRRNGATFNIHGYGPTKGLAEHEALCYAVGFLDSGFLLD